MPDGLLGTCGKLQSSTRRIDEAVSLRLVEEESRVVKRCEKGTYVSDEARGGPLADCACAVDPQTHWACPLRDGPSSRPERGKDGAT